MSMHRTSTKAAAIAALASLFLVPVAHAESLSASSAPAAQPAPRLAPFDKAHTFAQDRQGRKTRTLLVTALGRDTATVIDLSAIAGLYAVEAFDVISRFDVSALNDLVRQRTRTESVDISRLIGAGPRGTAHIAAGTNYAAHGQEVGHEQAFLFPKLSPATGPRSTVVAAAQGLLDYEVEVCARFDRDIRSLSDFDAARKGFFLCGDFTDRATLVRNIDLRNIGSGDGFADAKSGADRFPVGPFLVIPDDWQSFLRDVNIATTVNGERRQYAVAGDMQKDLRTIVKESLEESRSRTWSYQDGRIAMVRDGTIGTASAVLTGTGEGVVFKEPGPIVMKAVMGAPGRPQQLAAIDSYLSGEVARRAYLQPGDEVVYASNYLGEIRTTVVTEAQAGAPARPVPRWSLGIGTAVSDSVYAGEGTRVTPFPLLTYEGERFYWRGIGGGAHLYKQDGFALDATLSARMDGIDRDDFGRAELAARGIDRALLSDRDDALDLGLAASWRGTAGRLEFGVKGDVAGTSKGYEASLAYGYPVQWGRMTITPHAGISHLSKKLANYYYGTLPEEVARGLADYRPGSATVPRVGIDFVRPFAGRWVVIGNVSYRRLPGKLADSPLVGKDTRGVVSGFIGVGRGF